MWIALPPDQRRIVLRAGFRVRLDRDPEELHMRIWIRRLTGPFKHYWRVLLHGRYEQLHDAATALREDPG